MLNNLAAHTALMGAMHLWEMRGGEWLFMYDINRGIRHCVSNEQEMKNIGTVGYAENVLENKLCVKSCAGNLVSRHVKKKEWRSRAWMHYSGHQYACKETAQSK